LKGFFENLVSNLHLFWDWNSKSTYLFLILITSNKHLKQGQAQQKSRSCQFEAPFKVNF
jgi:hypothetical protein